MPVTRTYECDDCSWRWTQWHASSSDPYPECPKCAAGAAQWIPGKFAITGVKSKAVDMAQRIMEEDYGLTDARDNLREGDTVVKAPAPVQTAEAETLTRAMLEAARETGAADLSPDQAEAVKQFWQHPGMTPAPLQQKVAEAQMQAPAARSMGNDPIGNLHTAAKKAFGHVPDGAPAAHTMNLQVVSRADPSKLN